MAINNPNIPRQGVEAHPHTAPGARLSQPQHIRQLQNPWNFVRSFGNPGCCGWDTRAPFHLGNTPSRCARYRLDVEMFCRLAQTCSGEIAARQ
jgi:hypothetical protein